MFRDWSAAYRLFSEPRFDVGRIFDVIGRACLKQAQPEEPFVVAMDDSLLRKSGKKTPGVSWRRDPLGPPFQVNFVRAQRVLQISGGVPLGEAPGPVRMIPLDFCHAPTATKPRKNAPESEWAAYRRAQKYLNINRQGAERLRVLRERLKKDDPKRDLWAVVDGRFTNGTFLKNLPERTVAIGRVRSDARFHLPPSSASDGKRGRKLRYGDLAPTPEALRQDETVPWQRVRVYAADKIHEVRVKTIGPILWRAAGADRPLRLIVIAPLAYRPRKGSRLFYRDPAYLICTDPDAPLEKILQAYVARWDIEVNFRDEKQIIGVGQAQVRSAHSVQSAPALAVAAYALLHLAGLRAFGKTERPGQVPLPKWRRNAPQPRATTSDWIRQLRHELWSAGLNAGNFSDFSCERRNDPKPEKWLPDLKAAVLYAV